MKNNNQSNMDRFVKDLKEAENTLRYTLHLHNAFSLSDQQQLSSENISNCISTLMKEIGRDMDEFKCKNSYNFFGFDDFFKKNGDVSSEHNDDLAVLCTSYSFWDKILQQDAIVSSFVKLRKLITTSSNASFYDQLYLSKLTSKGTIDNYDSFTTSNGLDFLLQSRSSGASFCSLECSESNVPTVVISKKSTGTHLDLRPYEGNYAKSVESLCNTLAPFSIQRLLYGSSFTCFADIAKTLCVFEFTNFTKLQGDKDSPAGTGIRPILNVYKNNSGFSPNSYKSYIKSVNRLLAHVNPDFLGVKYKLEDNNAFHTLLPSDKIYLMYQIEKLFAPMTIDCLYQNINPTINTPYDLCDTATVNILSSCLQLPNVFSRQYIIQMAIDTITKHFNASFYNKNFFDIINQSHDAIGYSLDSRSGILQNYTKLDLWKEHYRQMMNYLTHILFPVYENYFFCVLWNSVKHSLKKDSVHVKDANVAIKMYELLRDYLNSDGEVNKLFDINKTLDEDPFLKNTSIKEHIICADFTSDQSKINSINRSIYKKCIYANQITTDNMQSESGLSHVPDFISLSYLDKLLGSMSSKKIQDFYILETVANLT